MDDQPNWWIKQQVVKVCWLQLILLLITVFVLAIFYPDSGSISTALYALVTAIIPFGLLAVPVILFFVKRSLQHKGVAVADIWRTLDFDTSGARLHNPKYAHHLAKDLHKSQIRQQISRVLALALLASWSIALATLASLALSKWHHQPPILPTAQAICLQILFVPILVIIGLSNNYRSSFSLALKPLIFRGLLTAVIAMAGFWLYFWLQHVSPFYLDPASNLALRAQTIGVILVFVCLVIQFIFDQARSFFEESKVEVTGLLLALLTLSFIYIQPFPFGGLTATDWVLVVLFCLITAAIELFVQHLQHHSRRRIIALHHEVHGRHATPKI